MKGKKLLCLCIFAVIFGCAETPPPDTEHEETLARTEFTERVENFFEYSPLRAGETSQFLIHLTDLADGTPVEGAEVVLTVRPAGAATSILQTTAQIGRVTGIYVAAVTVPQSGEHDIVFHIRNPKLDERMLLSGFEVQ
jgi:hypothetical protein